MLTVMTHCSQPCRAGNCMTGTKNNILVNNRVQLYQESDSALLRLTKEAANQH